MLGLPRLSSSLQNATTWLADRLYQLDRWVVIHMIVIIIPVIIIINLIIMILIRQGHPADLAAVALSLEVDIQ